MKGKKITKEKIAEMHKMLRKGYNRRSIADAMGLSYSAVCSHTQENPPGKRKNKKCYSLGVCGDAWQFIADVAKKKGITRKQAAELIIIKQKKRIFSNWI